MEGMRIPLFFCATRVNFVCLLTGATHLNAATGTTT